MSSPPSSSWSCPHCTFLNLPSHILSCQMCLSPSSITTTGGGAILPGGGAILSGEASTLSSRWPCPACTYLNPRESPSCEVCRATSRPFSRLRADDLDVEELSGADSSIGAIFFPLQRCRRKRLPEDCADDRSSAKMARSKVEEPLDSIGKTYPTSSSRQIMKILTYNVWFREDLEVYKRMEAIGNLILEHLPDFICFQEVTPNIYEMFQSSKWWKAYKCSVSQDIAAERAYFCMQMSKLQVEFFHTKPFANSIMGRELCLANIELDSGKKMMIATSHLESPCPAPPKWNQMYSTERVSQAKESLTLLKNSQNAIFAGDMNWDDKLDGDFPLPDGWIDAWKAIKPAENGWTYDTKSNNMLSGNRNLQKRLDRFLCCLKDFKVNSIEMIGTEAIKGLLYVKEKKLRNQMVKLELPVFPSDHYGILLTISSL